MHSTSNPHKRNFSIIPYLSRVDYLIIRLDNINRELRYKMTLLNVLIGAAIGFVISGLLFFIHRSSERRQFIDNQNRLSLKEIIDRDRQIKNLSAKINKLNELNSRYLSFV